MRYDSDLAAAVAYASAVVLVTECYAGCDADRRAELIVTLAPHLEASIHSYCEAAGCGRPGGARIGRLFRPSEN